MTAPALVITVHGQPKPKGSMRHVGGGRMVEQVTGSRPWREAVKYAALDALGQCDAYPFGTAPLAVIITYTVDRPKSAPRRRTWPVTRSSGDVDKVARNCLDALVDAAVMKDDAQVVQLEVGKGYAGEPGWLDRPGAVITVAALDGAL